QVPGDAVRMSTEDFRVKVLTKRGPLYRLLQRYCNAFMSMIAQSAVCNTVHTLEERACRWILMTHDRYRENEIPLSHKFLGMMLATRRTSLALVLGRLNHAGAIEYTPNSVTILSRKPLEEGACECYGIINRQFNGIFEDNWKKPKR